MKHDDHYRKIEESGEVSPIVRMEATVCLDLPEEFHAIARRNLSLALAQKYKLRAGHKDGEDAQKERDKEMNYLHRATTGEWMP